MKVYTLKTCDTCRKATKALTAAGLEFVSIDIRADGLEADEIAQMVAAFGDKAINRASTTWRGLEEHEKACDPAQLIARYPTLLKRPVIFKDGHWYQGWTARVQASINLAEPGPSEPGPA